MLWGAQAARLGVGVICGHDRVPFAECLSQSAIQGPGAGLQEQVGASLGPLHLLLLGEPLGDGSELAWALSHLRWARRSGEIVGREWAGSAPIPMFSGSLQRHNMSRMICIQC